MAATSKENSLELLTLVFQMHMAGMTQSAIAAYVGKSKTDINQIIKPLQKGKGGNNASRD